MDEESIAAGPVQPTPQPVPTGAVRHIYNQRVARLCGRCSFEAWKRLQRLTGHPQMDRLLGLLEAVDGTLHESDIERALRRVTEGDQPAARSATVPLSPQRLQALQDALDAAIRVQGADKGNIQVLDDTGALRIAVQRGFDRDFLEYFACVRVDGCSVCARSFRAGTPVLIMDVNEDPPFAPHLAIAHAAGFRGVQSIPLVNSAGSVVGVLSVHFRLPLASTEWRIQSLRECATRAAAILGRLNE